MGMALTGKVVPYKVGFGPVPGDVFHLPFPMELHQIITDDSLAALDRLFKSDLDPSRIAAIILETVKGEGGFYPAPTRLMKELRAVCDQHGILLIVDEVQTGFARTGKMFGSQHYDVVPDLITMAKSLAGGFPLAAVSGRADIMDAPLPGGLGGTYGGNPLGIAAARAVLDVIDEEGLCDRAIQLGNRLKQRLASLTDQVPEIAEVRGPGFMNAVEFLKPGTKKPDADLVTRVQQKALDGGLILLSCGVYANVIRFLAPITIDQHIFEEALDKIESSIVRARAA